MKPRSCVSSMIGPPISIWTVGTRVSSLSILGLEARPGQTFIDSRDSPVLIVHKGIPELAESDRLGTQIQQNLPLHRHTRGW